MYVQKSGTAFVHNAQYQIFGSCPSCHKVIHVDDLHARSKGKVKRVGGTALTTITKGHAHTLWTDCIDGKFSSIS